MTATVTPEMAQAYARDGVVLVKGLFSPDWVEVLRRGVEDTDLMSPDEWADSVRTAYKRLPRHLRPENA